MKTILKTLLPCSLIALVALSACEKEVEFEGPSGEVVDDMVINAVAVEGEPLKVFLNQAYPIGTQPVRFIDYEHAMYYENDYLTDYRNSNYYESVGIFDAEVTAVVNGSQTYNLALGSDGLSYVCGYLPQVNDHIVLRIKSSKSVNEAVTETIVPAKPKIEVVKHEVLNDNSYYTMNQMNSYADTIMRITCRISDAGGNQYYRLRIRGERAVVSETWYNPIYGRPNEINTYLRFQDIFFSDDPLFVDARLNQNTGGWAAYFSNVFDNSLMQGKDYTFTLDSPKPNSHFIKSSAHYSATGEVIFDVREVEGGEFEPRVMVELQSISPELYRYLKSAQLYRVSESDAFSEPVQIYSNVKNGWGIFGSLSSSRVFIPYD